MLAVRGRTISYNSASVYEVDEFENFAKILKAVDEATSNEDIIDYFREDSFYCNSRLLIE